MDATLYLKNLNGFRHDKMSTFRTQLYALRLDISLGNLSQVINKTFVPTYTKRVTRPLKELINYWKNRKNWRLNGCCS